MRIKYFDDTDTLYIEINGHEIAETLALNDDVVLDLDDAKRLAAITIGHARANALLDEIVLTGFPPRPAS